MRRCIPGVVWVVLGSQTGAKYDA
ncbi:uncharacterized protein METZ01_LOCUS243441, partial [marine metagenome]